MPELKIQAKMIARGTDLELIITVRMAVHLEETCSYYQLNLGKIVPTTLEKFGSFIKSSVCIYNMT